jgi:hypothetical protein
MCGIGSKCAIIKLRLRGAGKVVKEFRQRASEGQVGNVYGFFSLIEFSTLNNKYRFWAGVNGGIPLQS